MAKRSARKTAKKTGDNKTDLRAKKKEAVLGTSKKGISGRLALAVAAVALACVAGVMFLLPGGNESPTGVVAEPNVVSKEDHVVTYAVSIFEDGRARHYELKAGDKNIRYFIIKSSDGVIRAAFDACDVCWPAGKGYFQDGDVMVCRNCGRQFASVLVNEVQGGCNPAPLNRKVEGDQLVITKADILNGARYFDFKGGTSG